MNIELIVNLVEKADRDFQLALVPADIVEKFTELIVQECARISVEADHTMTNQGAASAQAFMEHFGVE